MSVNQLMLQRMEELVDQLKDISMAVSSQYGGNNMHQEVKRVADSLQTSTYELSRIASALETIVEELTK